MNYQKIYDQLVDKCIARGLNKKLLKGYFEKHHIVPKCLGGLDNKDNFVLFTPREHVIAHRLLWKANPENYSLMWAYARTVNSHKSILTSREVEVAKIAKAKVMSERVVSQETRDKISATLMGSVIPQEVIEKRRIKQIGQKRTDETKAKLKQARKELLESGWTHSEESRKKISEGAKGRIISQETRDKISLASKGRPLPEHVKLATAEYQRNLKPWEKSSVKARPARKLVWKTADNLYALWLAFDMPKGWAFSSSYNQLFNTDHKTYHFDTTIKLFHEGWIPQEDDSWSEWSLSV